jgi:hypothetical protein
MIPALTAFVASSIVLYFSWYRKLPASGVGEGDPSEAGG